MNVATMESLVRSGLNEQSTAILSQAEIYTALNDGYKDVASKAFCAEAEAIEFTAIGDRRIAVSNRRIGFIVNASHYHVTMYVPTDSDYILPRIVSYLTTDDGDYLLTDSGDYFFIGESYVWADSEATLYLNNMGGVPKSLPNVFGREGDVGTIPQNWFQWGAHIVVDPIPVGEYPVDLFYSAPPLASMAASTDTPGSLPSEFELSIVDFALYTLSIKLKSWGKAEKYYRSYARNLRLREMAYIKRIAEKRSAHRVPGTVSYLEKRTGQ